MAVFVLNRKYILKRIAEITDAEGVKYALVQSHLIAAELHEDAEGSSRRTRTRVVFFTTWDDLIERAKLRLVITSSA
jgi:hypothetical protein